MKISRTALWLSLAVGILAAVAASFGLFWQAGSGPFEFTTVHGALVQIYGEGLYRYDTPIAALGIKAGDCVTLCLFSLSLFGLIITLRSFDLEKLAAQFSPRVPRRGIGVFCIVSGAVLTMVWLVLSIIPALLRGTHAEEAEYSTTFITGVIDIGVVAPVLIVSGALLVRRAPLGNSGLRLSWCSRWRWDRAYPSPEFSKWQTARSPSARRRCSRCLLSSSRSSTSGSRSPCTGDKGGIR